VHKNTPKINGNPEIKPPLRHLFVATSLSERKEIAHIYSFIRKTFVATLQDTLYLLISFLFRNCEWMCFS